MGKYEPASKPVRKTPPRRDPCVANIDEIEPEAYERKDVAGLAWDLGAATGSRLVGVDVTEIAPGRRSSTFHAHGKKEEFFFVLSGRCRLRLGAAEHELREGDAVSRPAGTGVPHQFLNPYDAPCRVLMFGVMAGKGLEDVVELPEAGLTVAFDEAGTRKLERRG